MPTSERKLPREFKEVAEGWRPDDPGWLKGLLAEAKTLLIRRLLQGRGDAMKILALDLIAFGPFTDRRST